MFLIPLLAVQLCLDFHYTKVGPKISKSVTHL